MPRRLDHMHFPIHTKSLLQVTPLQASVADRAAVAGEPSVEVGCVASTVAFNRRVHRVRPRWCRRVFDRERCRGARGVAAVVRRSEGDCCRTRCSAIGAQRVEVVAPGHSAASVRCRSAAVAGEPSVEIGCVASAVAFNRRVHRFRIARWRGRVLDRERCRGARGVAAVVRRSEGDCCRTRCSAIVAQRVEVVAPGHSAASVRCRSAAVAGEPSVEVCAVASTVAFNRRVHRIHDSRCRRVFDRERCRGARGVAAVVRRSERYCRRSSRSAIGAQRVEVVAPGHSAASVRCRSAAVAGEPSVEVGCVAGAIAFNGRVHRVHYCWCRRVFDRERCRGARGVAAVVRRSERYCRRSSRSAIGAQRVEVVAPGHSAASVRCRSAAVAGEPSVEVGSLPAPSHSTVASIASITAGAVVSSIVNVAVVLVALPQSSVAVKVTVAAPVAPQSALNASKSLLQVTPLQASVAEAPPLLASQASRSAALPAPSHSTVASIASTTAGAVVSSIVNVAVVLVALPQSSVAVKVTVAAPVAPQSALNASKSLLQVTPLQASVAEAPPLLASQASRSAALPAPSHSTVASIASTTILGAIASVTVMTCVHDSTAETLPHASVELMLNVRVNEKEGPHKLTVSLSA